MSISISVIIPTYNGEKYIKRAILSVLKQTLGDFEIIVVDDFSSDDTVNVVRELQAEDSRIKLIVLNSNSGGPARPKNEGFKISCGKYIAYLDQDDEWLPSKLEEQLKIFEDSNDDKLGLVSCGAILINSSGKYFGYFIPVKNNNIFPEILLRNPIYSNSSVLIKREVIDIAGERDEHMKYSEDLEMWIHIASLGYSFGYIYKPLFKYYFHDSNVTSKLDKDMKVIDMEYTFNKYKNLYEKYSYVHVGLFRLGVMYLLSGNIRKSREFFISSIKFNKLFAPSYFGYVFTLLGSFGIGTIKILIFIYRLSKGRRYLILSGKQF